MKTNLKTVILRLGSASRRISFFLFMWGCFAALSMTETKAQSFFSVVKQASISTVSTGGFTTDTLFTLSQKYEFVSFQVFGNGGEYATIRAYAGNTEAGILKVYAGQIINYPNPPNLVSILPDFDIDLSGTLTDWVNSKGDTIKPFVYCIAWTK